MNDNQTETERWLADAEAAAAEGHELLRQAHERFAYADKMMEAFKPDGRRKPLTPDLMAALRRG